MNDSPDNLARIELCDLDPADALDLIGLLVDHAADSGNLMFADRALALADQLRAQGLGEQESVVLDYFRANAWACRYHKTNKGRAELWAFEQPELLQQILLLRQAANAPAFESLESIRKCQILTNLANQFDAVGRFIEARKYWSQALKIDPNFWMAKANRGRGLLFYASALYDPGHACVFAHYAHQDLVQSVDLIRTHPHLGDPRLQELFARAAMQIAEHHDLDGIRERFKPDEWPLGATLSEVSYRKWCLAHSLFLNPLNDAANASIAASDVLTLPSFRTAVGEPPLIVGMFNELKQLYVSARWILWEGKGTGEPHFSDSGVLLFNTLDYPSYCLSVERVKAAFRMSYSLFDKVAYFLNFYLDLQIAGHAVSFKSIWRAKKNQPVRESIDQSENWPLRGLYWLSKDLFEPSTKDAAEPDARDLADLRNELEHKHVVVHDMFASSHTNATRAPGHPYRIGRSELEQKALRLLQLARSALIYLSLAVHYEERRRFAAADGPSFPMRLDEWDDEWKR